MVFMVIVLAQRHRETELDFFYIESAAFLGSLSTTLCLSESKIETIRLLPFFKLFLCILRIISYIYNR